MVPLKLASKELAFLACLYIKFPLWYDELKTSFRNFPKTLLVLEYIVCYMFCVFPSVQLHDFTNDEPTRVTFDTTRGKGVVFNVLARYNGQTPSPYVPGEWAGEGACLIA